MRVTPTFHYKSAHSVPLLANLADEELDTIANAMRVQVFEDREYIIRQGEVRWHVVSTDSPHPRDFRMAHASISSMRAR
jgi:hypothetical protein